jgi:maleylpyruvate isomerase
MDDRELDETVAGCAAAHQRLLAHLDRLDEGDVRRPSLLAEWSVGHVLTHLSRNADSHVRMLTGAELGAILDQYEGGFEARAAAIEAGAGRSADELVGDVRRSIWRLEEAWATTTRRGWAGSGRGSRGDLQPCTDLPFRRWREVEVHHADLGLPGFSAADWSSGYVRRELDRQQMVWRSRTPMGIGGQLAEALALAPHVRLAWLLGRVSQPDLPELGPWG